MRRKLVVGNWKMNGSLAANGALLDDLLKEQGAWNCDVAVCAPFPYLAQLRERLEDSALHWGAQDCSAHHSGAFTGEVSAAMVAEFGCRYVIVGHSERRAMHGESDQLVADKAQAALAQGLTPIVCVGETLNEREAGVTDEIVKRQLAAVVHTLARSLSQIVVAYEPVWAIGTGRTATPDEAQAVHAVLRAKLRAATEQSEAMQILYGGSVKADNAATLFAQPDIDGGLIGGASLKAADFTAICRVS